MTQPNKIVSVSSFKFHALKNDYNIWLQSPVRVTGAYPISDRCDYIDNFIMNGLAPFLKLHKYSLGKNLVRFKKNLAYWWYYTELGYKTHKVVVYNKPQHRDHKYDKEKFFDTITSDIFNTFFKQWEIEGFLDDSDVGRLTLHTIKYFIYTWIDLAASPAREEVDEILREEEEIRIMREKIKKHGINSVHNRHDYDTSELGYYRGNRNYTD
jgi:hypothetical protein